MTSWVQCMYRVVNHNGPFDFGNEYWRHVYEQINKEHYPSEYIEMHHLLANHHKYVELRKKNRDMCFFVKLKYGLLQKAIDVPFNSPAKISMIITLFGKSQKIYHGFVKFAHMWRVNRSPLRIECDLCLNPLTTTDSKSTMIYQDGSRYMFKISDLINICKTSLTHSDEFFSEPMIPKNPYTNMEFTQPILYKIYDVVRRSNYRMPILLHLFYLSEFDVEVFLHKNEAIIRYEHIIDYTKNGEDNELTYWVHHMLGYTNMDKEINIHTDFPKNVLIEAMRPFLKDYFISQYSLYNTNERRHVFNVLKYKLRKFKDLSPRFGRQIMVRIENSRKFKRVYQTDFVSYQQINMDEFDEDTSSYNDSDDDSDDDIMESDTNDEEYGMTDETNPSMQSAERIQSLLEALSTGMINATYRVATPILSDSEDENTHPDGDVDENTHPDGDVDENTHPDGDVDENTHPDGDVDENTHPDGDVDENDL